MRQSAETINYKQNKSYYGNMDRMYNYDTSAHPNLHKTTSSQHPFKGESVQPDSLLDEIKREVSEYSRKTHMKSFKELSNQVGESSNDRNYGTIYTEKDIFDVPPAKDAVKKENQILIAEG